MQTLITALALSGALTLPQVTPLQAEQAQTLFETVAPGFPALNATVMVDGEIVFEAEGGAQTGPEDGVETAYNVYSTAKLLTGLAFAKLEHDQGLDLDQSVRLIDPNLPEAYQAVTVRQLLSHTAGVRGYTGEADWLSFNDRRCSTPADALAHFIEAPLISAPGERFTYTTYGYVLLSHLLVTLTETDSFDAAMTAVLGDAYQARSDHEDADKAVTYHDLGDGLAPIPLSAECKFGGGGLIASSRELAAMGAAFANGDVVPLEILVDLLAPSETSSGEPLNYVYGMGAGYVAEAGLHYAAHSGGSPGGRSFVLVYVEPQVVVATSANSDGPNHQDLATGLADIFTPDPQ